MDTIGTPNSTDLFLQYPKVSANLIYTQTSSRQYAARDTQTGRYFKLNEATVQIMQHLDGTRSSEELIQELNVKPLVFQYVLDQLVSLQLLETGAVDNGKQVNTFLSRLKRLFFQLVLLRKDIITSDKLLTRIYRFLGLKYILQTWLMIILVILYIYAYFIYINNYNLLSSSINDLFVWHADEVYYILIGFGIYLLSNILHELSHGFVCKRFGGNIRAIGVGLYYLQPVFYCDVTDAWFFSRRYQRIMTHAAGVLMELFLGSLALCILPFVAHIHLLVVALTIVFLIAGVFTLFNLNPLIQLDGYYILADALGIANMRQRAFDFLFSSMRYILYRLHLKKSSPSLYNKRYKKYEKLILIFYAILSIAYIFSMLWFLGIKYSWFLARYLGQWYWIVSGIFIFTLLVIPLWRGWKDSERYSKRLQQYANDLR